MDTYFVKANSKVLKQDLKDIPHLSELYEGILDILRNDPFDLEGVFSWHYLTGTLEGYRAIEIGDTYTECYRLIYRILPLISRVEVISFNYHDQAYNYAIQRLNL